MPPLVPTDEAVARPDLFWRQWDALAPESMPPLVPTDEDLFWRSHDVHFPESTDYAMSLTGHEALWQIGPLPAETAEPSTVIVVRQYAVCECPAFVLACAVALFVFGRALVRACAPRATPPVVVCAEPVEPVEPSKPQLAQVAP